jgi:hypothetical protein
MSLIELITKRTEEGKIVWHLSHPHCYSAHLRGYYAEDAVRLFLNPERLIANSNLAAMAQSRTIGFAKFLELGERDRWDKQEVKATPEQLATLHSMITAVSDRDSLTTVENLLQAM